MDVKDQLLMMKEFLPVLSVVEYLSKTFSEKLSKADVLKFVIDGHLKLSVYFPNGTWARRGELVEFEDAEWIEGYFLLRLNRGYSLTFDRNFPLNSMRSREFCPRRVLKSLIIADTETLNTGGEDKFNIGQVYNPSVLPFNWDPDGEDYYSQILNFLKKDSVRFLNLGLVDEEIRGVWDLFMSEGAHNEIKDRHHKLAGISFHNEYPGNILVENKDGSKLFRLRDEYAPDLNSDDPLSVSAKIANQVADSLEEFTDEEFEQHAVEIKSHIDHFEIPATNLPEDSVLVVRPQALIDFRDKMLSTLSEMKAPSVEVQLDDKMGKGIASLENKKEWRTGNRALCEVFGVSHNSMTSVRNKVRNAGIKFEYDPETGEKRLPLALINEILAGKEKK